MAPLVSTALAARGFDRRHYVGGVSPARWIGWGQALPDLPSALYFSMVTYTTTGYGDLVLPKGWRLVGGVEALTGILMGGWSTGLFFVVVSRMYAVPRQQTAPDPPNAPTNQAQ
jgi:hypothetical protein